MNAFSTLKRASCVNRWLLPVLLLLLSWSFKGNAQVTIQVGTGTTTSSYVPLYSCYGYNYSQTIYLQSEVIAAGATGASLITKIRYYYNTAVSSTNWNQWVIYMGNTTQTTFATTTSWISSGTLSQVFSGAVTIPSSGGQWIEIPLTTPFYWDGTSNLVVAVDENVPGYTCTATWRSTAIGTSTNYRSILYYSDVTNPNPTSPPTANYRTNSIPNTQFEIVPAVPCAGTPTGGTTVANPSTPCYNSTTVLSLSGATLGLNLTYQWETYNGSAWVPVTGGSGATTANYTTPPISGSAQYRCAITCTNSSATSYSAPLTVTAAPLTPPYTETFESITANNTLPSCMSATSLGSYVYTYTAPTGSYNQTNHTIGGSKFASFRYGANDRIITPAINLVGGQLYQFSFWYITDGYTGWNTLRATYGNAPNAAGLTNTITTVTNAMNTTYQMAVGQFTPTTSGTYYFGVECQASGVPWYLSVDDINLVALPPCSGTPTAGTVIPAGPLSGCPGSSYALSTTGTTTAANLSYQWIQATNAAPNTYTPAAGTGANTLFFTTGVLSDTTRFRMVVTCNNSGMKDTTPVMIINVPKVPYASIPYLEDFESWSTRCNPTDIPSQYWTNIPSTGNPSWRRHDQGASASWTSPTTGSYNPVSASGSYSARFHNYYATPNGTRGRMDVYVNCGGATGNKELQFFLRMDNSIYATGDSLLVYLSTNGGGTFTQIGGYDVTNNWELKSLPIVSNSATTIIRFEGKSYNYYTDIGIDKVQVLPPCSGTPVAGAINNVTPCSGQNFTLSLSGTSQVAGLTYLWQSSTTGTGGWTNVPSGTTPLVTTTITAPTYFRCIVTCSNSNLSDTTAVKYVTLAPFYVCYCNSGANYNTYEDIGNVTIATQPANVAILNNGTSVQPLSNSTAVNTYTNFTNLTPTVMYRDSLYKSTIAQITSSTYTYSCGIGVFIDYNRNGIYDANEQVLNKTSLSTGTPSNPYTVSDTFRVPSNAMIGVTGMRVVMYEFGTATACGAYGYGETEDYLVDLRYPPCDGPTNAGTATISDATMCVGYDIFLSDTTHEYERSGITWSWQSSTDNVNWSVIPGTTDRDTLTQTVTGAAWYRLRMLCSITGDTTYSNAVSVTINQPWQCYCYSIALGGKLMDTTDIGAFSIGDFVMPLTNIGPHLYNPRAIYGRTDYTDVTGLELWADSTYEVNYFQTLPRGIHSDAKVTMFIDYNNNLVYDVPDERVLTMFTTPTNWYLVNDITIPNAVIPNVPTGLRVIINSNVGPNVPSDEACGAYTSGETEDYVVTLRRGIPSGVGNTGLVKDLSLYPNPTEGRFTVQFTMAQPVKDLEVVVTNLTGQTVLSQSYSNPVRQFRTEMDLTAQPRGVYLVEVHADGNKTVRKLIVR